MSGRPALSSEASMPRLVVLDDGAAHDVFEVVSATASLIQVRTAFLFEIGEELSVRIEQGGSTSEATARVRSHAGPPEARITELEISDRSAPRGQAR
jgi:hypothetical protein